MEKQKTEKPEQEKNSLLSAYEWLESIVSAIVICILIFLFVVRVVSVDGGSMTPTLLNGEKVIISRLYNEPRQGDIVVFTKKSFGDESLVKRVIATEGQTIDIDFDRGIVTVDGVQLDEPYIAELTHRALDMHTPLTVDEGCIFVMGDNRNESTDSRSNRIGQVDKRCVLGKVLLRVWPLNKAGRVDSRG
jgi:signal peptidase I